MALTPEQIAAIYEKKAAPVKRRASTGSEHKRRLTRIATQYAKLPANHLIRYSEVGMRCESYGCGSPTYVYFRKEPLCTTHALIAMVHEINLLTSHGKIRISELDRREAEVSGTSGVFVRTFTHGREPLDQTSGVSDPAQGSLVGELPQAPHNGADAPLVLAASLIREEEEGEDDSYL